MPNLKDLEDFNKKAVNAQTFRRQVAKAFEILNMYPNEYATAFTASTYKVTNIVSDNSSILAVPVVTFHLLNTMKGNGEGHTMHIELKNMDNEPNQVRGAEMLQAILTLSELVRRTSDLTIKSVETWFKYVNDAIKTYHCIWPQPLQLKQGRTPEIPEGWDTGHGDNRDFFIFPKKYIEDYWKMKETANKVKNHFQHVTDEHNQTWYVYDPYLVRDKMIAAILATTKKPTTLKPSLIEPEQLEMIAEKLRSVRMRGAHNELHIHIHTHGEDEEEG